ncbi:MAG: transaldolase family protein, partial [Terriglobia bacterium]
EVFSDLYTTAELLLSQGQDMFTWIPNAYIKYPCTHEGLRAAKMSVEQGMRVNITLCFSQEQAAGVYAATQASKQPAYVSPFIGRLDDRGENGMDLVKNIRKMYLAGDGHVHILAASVRSTDQLLACFALGADLVTVPAKILDAWAEKNFPMPDRDFVYKGVDKSGEILEPIAYKNIDLNKQWDTYDLNHELTRKGIERFVTDYESSLNPASVS